MNFPLSIKRNENCVRIIGYYMDHGSSHQKYWRKNIRKCEKVRIEQRSMKAQRRLCMLYDCLVKGNVDSGIFSLPDQCCSECEIYEYMTKYEEIETLITRKAGLETEYKIVCEAIERYKERVPEDSIFEEFSGGVHNGF